MSHVALIRLGRLVSPDVLLNIDSLKPDAEWFQRGALRLRPDAPVLVDHDDEREVGFVRKLVELPDTDGEWLGAFATITDPPAWLKRDTPASINYVALHRQALGEAQRILRGLVTEVSILSPHMRAAIPGARVLTFRRADQESSRAARPDRLAAGEVIAGNGQLIRRYFQTEITVR